MPFREIAESTYDWESWIDPQGRALWINAAVTRITGYEVEECLAHPDYPLFLVHPEDRARLETVLVDARQGGSGNHFEFRILRKDGALRWGAISWQPLTETNGSTRGYRSSVRDIDDRKRMEAELRRSVAKAEAASEAKTVFLASVSHELKTPLQSILGYGELLAQGASPELVQRYAERIVSQARGLDQLVGDLLDFSSMQAGGLPLRVESCNVSEVVGEALHGFRPLFANNGVELVWDGGAHETIRCDRRRVTQIVNNLVSNALKFTTTGSVSVSSFVDRQRAEWRLTVDDTGVGVPPSRRECIFDPFYQEDAIPQGVGLGLAITRHLAENMGGGIRCEESPQGGARFVVTLATNPGSVGNSSPSEGSEEKREVPAVPLGESKRLSRPALHVLVVDDVDPAREFLEEALRGEGAHCLSAASATEGYRILESNRPDLILVDIQMPGIDGWMAASKIRELLGPKPYLVAMSASGLADDPEKLKSAGFNGFCLKPLGLADLRDLLVQAKSHSASIGAPPGEFAPERWKELSEIHTAKGDTLLARMTKRVFEELPPIVEEVRTLSCHEQPLELAGALHKASGLLALIGAQSAYAIVAQAEELAEAKSLSKDDARVQQSLAAMERVILELESHCS